MTLKGRGCGKRLVVPMANDHCLVYDLQDKAGDRG